MNQHPMIMTDDDEETEAEELIEVDFGDLFSPPSIPWYKRFWYRMLRRDPPELEEFVDNMEIIEEEFSKRLAVSDCVEAALASTVWMHRGLEQEMPRLKKYYVVGMAIRDRGPSEFWLYVEIQPIDEDRRFHLPLHEFLEQCYPAGDLTFLDYNA